MWLIIFILLVLVAPARAQSISNSGIFNGGTVAGATTFSPGLVTFGPTGSTGIGYLAIENTSTADQYLYTGYEPSGNTNFPTDYITGVSYNKYSNGSGAFTYQDTTQPSVDMGLESCYSGGSGNCNFELNIDMADPNTQTGHRPFGWYATYGGAGGQYNMGTTAYGSGSSGISLSFGQNALLSTGVPQETITAPSSPTNGLVDFRLQTNSAVSYMEARQYNSTSRFFIALDSSQNMNGVGANGLFRILGSASSTWGTGNGSIFRIESTNSRSSEIISTKPISTDTNDSFDLLANGNELWGPGTAAQDTTLARDSAGGLDLTGGAFNAPSYAVSGTAGVTCSGSPSASFAVTNGIVTHC